MLFRSGAKGKRITTYDIAEIIELNPWSPEDEENEADEDTNQEPKEIEPTIKTIERNDSSSAEDDSNLESKEDESTMKGINNGQMELF